MLSGVQCLEGLYKHSGASRPMVKDGWHLIPHTPQPKQQRFLDLECREALYGGAGGGGKSDCLLMDGFRFAHIPTYSAIYFRRKLTDAALSGAIMERAIEWFPREYWDAKHSRFVFPCRNGYSKIQFAYLSSDIDRFRYASAEFHRIYFDELTHFTELQYSFLFTRLRRTVGCDIPLAVRSGTNPGGPGEEWVYKRFLDEKSKRKDTAFVPAKVSDNKFINAKEYGATLGATDERTRRQILDGEWMVPDTGRLYPIDDGNIIDELPDGFGQYGVTYGLGIDLGSSQQDPNTTFVVGAIQEHDSNLYVLKTHAHAGASIKRIAEVIDEIEKAYGPMQIVVDEGGLGGYITEELRSRYSIGAEAAKKTDKLGARRALVGKIEDRLVRVISKDCQGLLIEARMLRWNDTGTDNNPKQRNHYTDAFLYMSRLLMPELAEPKKPVYARGSAEYYAEAERRMLENDEQQQQKRKSNIDAIDQNSNDWNDDWFDGSKLDAIDEY